MADDRQHLRDQSLIEREAIAWFTRMNGKPSRQEQSDFQRWLEVSPDHRRVYDEVCGMWQDLGSTAWLAKAGADPDLSVPLEKIRRLRDGRKVGKIGPIVVGCLAFLVAGCWFWLERPTLLQDMQADFVSPRGERRQITLDDGSRVLLDADTAIDVVLSGPERRVRLLRGTAFFSVVHTGKPFVVEAQNGEARVLGTEFDVAMKEDRQVSVTLARGSVEVGISGDTQDVLLKPGESVDYGESGIGQVQEAVIQDEMAWHEGRFVFNNARLSNVLAQIGRYRDGRIVVIGSAIGDLRVSGNITLDDTDKALAAVQSSVGFQMHSFGKLTVVGP
ncbi:DUF4880 domain-containing protein [Rhizobium lusitanum]|uniref:DUF4880 domain-containing protein n=1 Tax=Rhizobium lusitanum TaxID=293958 RepID=A0A6L9UCB2_9HYPH|nr:FecR family protein [Rhizobium lusitanum]NEI72148.1 DUF4880 domain-containing protein [Rhizobium lusitanum]